MERRQRHGALAHFGLQVNSKIQRMFDQSGFVATGLPRTDLGKVRPAGLIRATACLCPAPREASHKLCHVSANGEGSLAHRESDGTLAGLSRSCSLLLKVVCPLVLRSWVGKENGNETTESVTESQNDVTSLHYEAVCVDSMSVHVYMCT